MPEVVMLQVQPRCCECCRHFPDDVVHPPRCRREAQCSKRDTCTACSGPLCCCGCPEVAMLQPPCSTKCPETFAQHCPEELCLGPHRLSSRTCPTCCSECPGAVMLQAPGVPLQHPGRRAAAECRAAAKAASRGTQWWTVYARLKERCLMGSPPSLPGGVRRRDPGQPQGAA